MAIVKSGPMVGFSGTVGGITYSTMADGRTSAKQKNRMRVVPATADQTTVMNDTVLCAKFMRPLKEFVHVGYALEAKNSGQNPYNAMMPVLRQNAITGSGEDRHVNFSKVLMTKGNLTKVTNAAADMGEAGVEFTWNTETIDSNTHWSDQVMLMAYFSELNEARYITSGPERHVGKALLQLAGIKKGYAAEIFISFVANDRTSISDSVHLGQLNW